MSQTEAFYNPELVKRKAGQKNFGGIYLVLIETHIVCGHQFHKCGALIRFAVMPNGEKVPYCPFCETKPD